MSIVWKYFDAPKDNSIYLTEELLHILLPNDYKTFIQKCNGSKPSLQRFDIPGRKECVLDYMLNVNPNTINCLLEASERLHKNGMNQKLIPIAIDPFGNYITYDYRSSSLNPEVVFWNHENNNTAFIAKDMTVFFAMLY